MQKPNKSKSYSDQYTPSIQRKGYTQVPNCLILCQSSLGISTVERTVLEVLLTFSFTKKEVYISHSRLATHIGRCKTTAAGAVKSLNNKGFINISHKVGSHNTYNLLPLMKQLGNHKCIHNIGQLRPHYLSTDTAPYQHTDTKEEVSKRRIKRSVGGYSSISELLERKAKTLKRPP